MFEGQEHTRDTMYRELVESTNSIILVWDREGRVLFMNQFGLDLFGYRSDELVGRKVTETIVARTESTGRDLEGMLEDIIANPENYKLNKNENLCRDGSTVWIQWSNRPLFDDRGRFTGMLSVGINVTSLELTRLQLQENELRFKTLYETSHDAILILEQGLFTCCNRQAEVLFGCSRNEILGKNPLDFSWPSQPGGRSAEEMHQEHLARVKAGERVCFEWYFRRNNEEKRVGEVNLNPVKSGKFDYLQISIQDTTERKELEAKLRQHQKMKAIGTLAGGIAHDFNNILTAIMGFTEIALRKAGKDSPVREELKQVRGASIRARDLIRQILTFSRKSPHSRQPVQFKLIVREATRLLRSSFPATIAIHRQLDSDAFVNADPTQMHQVIMNLGTNAMQAMENRGGELGITLTDINDPGELPAGLAGGGRSFIRLEVRDTGIGIAPEMISKIFDPYFTTKELAKGSGMGLAVVHGIVESHGGSITVTSEPGHGSVFSVFLPVTTPSPPLKEAAPSPLEDRSTESAPRGRQRIMFVDDEQTLRELAAEFLTSQGYSVHTFSDGMQAWQAFEEDPEHWDLVITDQTMPRMTGIELIAKIRRLSPDQPPILLSTGYSDNYNREDIQQLGISDILQKPSSLQQLLDTVRAALDS